MSKQDISKPLKILYFSRDHTVHDQRFLEALAKTEHQVYFLYLENRQPPENRVLKLPPKIEAVQWAGNTAPSDFRVFFTSQPSGVLYPPTSGRSVPPDLQLLSDLKQVITDLQPDLIQAGPLHLSAYLAAQAGFQPLISMSWGYDLLYDAPRSAETRQAIRYTLEHSAAMVGDCQTIRQLAVSYGMPEERIVTFPWGIDLGHYSTINHQPLTGAITLLSTRNWEPIYGVDVIAQAFVLAAREIPELRLVMLGSGSQSSLIRQILQEGGVLDKVRFPGSVGQSELPGLYQAADLYVSASHSDGTSISLLEALACGKPVIVSDIPGNCEWVTPGVHGWLFPDGNSAALAQAIITAAQRKHTTSGREELAEMGRAARQLAEQRADWNKNFPELFRAYEIALGFTQVTQ